MAEKRRFLDVWIIESNTVYREVPFDVVADWIQQGRLLEDDKVRPSGTAEWFKIGAVPGFAAYLPKPEPTAEVNPVEALEPVEVGFTWKRKPDEDETDVDMIPLIDVSLVLLIYFVIRLMTIDAAGANQPIPTPTAEHGDLYAVTPDSLWIGIDVGGNGDPVYSVGEAGASPKDQDRDLTTPGAALDRLGEMLKTRPTYVDLTVNAHPDLPEGLVDALLAALETRISQEKKDAAEGKSPPEVYRKVVKKYTGVTGKSP
jgi:biopolymer transport protein ExbD